MKPLFANLLRQHRERAGMTQSAVARGAACAPAYINRAELAKQGMSRQMTESIAVALGLDAYDTAQLLAAAGYWPWPDVAFKDVLSMLECGASLDRLREAS